jgi:FMN phosphatase YigB (HAD superfamily)
MTRSYKAIFFDLDGTLIPMEMDEFLTRYARELGIYLAKKGLENHEAITKAVFTCTHAMTQPHEGTNADAFWAAFEQETGLVRAEFEPFMEEFYTGPYNKVGEGLEFPLAAKAIEVLKGKGYPLYLTTMPLFPPIGVIERLSWVGIDAGNFERITNYENSHYVKPMLEYFQENLDFAGLSGEDVLVVGNHTREDMASLKLGCDGYLVNDMLLNPEGKDYSAIKNGTFAEFLEFARALPPCGATALANGEGE